MHHAGYMPPKLPCLGWSSVEVLSGLPIEHALYALTSRGSECSESATSSNTLEKHPFEHATCIVRESSMHSLVVGDHLFANKDIEREKKGQSDGYAQWKNREFCPALRPT